METRKAVLKGFDAGAYLATVQISGSLSVWLQGVPVARNIPTAEMITGRNCAVIFFDPSNPKDGVVVAVYV
ncbi:MAG: hypothetical protein IH860_03520 [Chloroflexi bacterium]|nr:hypothetical protein [Chloroflexota bacterium]